MNKLLLKERLKLLPEWSNPQRWLESLEVNKIPFAPTASDFDRAWRKFNVCHKKSLLALAFYFSEDLSNARVRGDEFLCETEDFFFGDWRNIYLTEDRRPDPAWWKRNMSWIEIYEAGLLWGSACGKWSYLQRLGTFPEPDSSPGFNHKPQERDLYVAWGAFLCGAPAAEVNTLLEKAANGSKKLCKMLAAIIYACLARDQGRLQKNFNEFMKYYRKSEFPKQEVDKKVSIEGTFFVHWAEKEGLPLNVPAEFIDHIVRLS